MRRSFAGRPSAGLVTAAFVALSLGCGAPRPDAIRIATTTSVDNSGLLDALVPAFEQESGVNVQVIAVGSGQAFALGRRGDVALLMTHEPGGERALVDAGLVRHYRKVMFNRFVIAGPADDPARVADAATAHDAMLRIATSHALFVSRGDGSGTHVREQQLWKAAGARPAAARLIETGQGMAPTLRVASQRAGYVLTDEATLARLADAVAVRALSSGDAALLNTYAVVILTTAPPDTATVADRLAHWLAVGPGQDRIDGFRIKGRQVFFRWPSGVDATTPESMPPGLR
ncbi:MAG: substrate-binding domain-containing protein [Acidobacteriota bacterium]|nr:substrate-binding domain-containing protein [Acidobacteriota bacterium]